MIGRTERKFFWGAVLAILLLCFLIPVVIVWEGADEKKTTAEVVSSPKRVDVKADAPTVGTKKAVDRTIAVYRSSQEKIEKVELDQYLFGVLAGEMPASFEMEALKAQAVAARTYITRIIYHSDGGNLPEGADVTDTVMHQVYHSEEELQKLWGDEYTWKADKLKQAIDETEDLVLTYNSEPISALFFSTSNGHTENAEEYWKNALPYLKSVPSPWDIDTPKFNQKKVFTIKDFQNRLGVAIQKNGKLMSQTKRSTGRAIATTKIGQKVFTGREVREKLELASADFSMKWLEGEIVITTKGYGHQVGMSQYGANGMAKEGKTFQQILLHYYTDAALEDGLSFFVDQKL